MQSRILLGVLILCITNTLLYGQEKIVKPLSSEVYLNKLKNSKDSLYVQILKEFDNYLNDHPNDYNARIEKCIIIDQAYYDSYEEYNPKYEEFEICLNDLIKDFPENHEVLLFKLKNTYGDSSLEFCNQVINTNRMNPGKWPDYKLAKFYQELALQYSYKEEWRKAIENAKIAEELNDTLDLSALVAEQYMALNNYEEAKKELFRSLDSMDNAWESQNKGNLLLKLGEPEKALQAFNYARRDTSIWIDNGLIAKALIDNGKYAEAREFLLKDLSEAYYSSASLHQLFAYDYKHSPADTTLTTYSQLNSASFLNDAFGKYRFMMFTIAPFSAWDIYDLIKLLIFILSIILLIILPYLWILPIHYISNYFKIKEVTTSLNGVRWGLKDFWIISAAVMLIEFAASIIFNYQGLLSTLFNDYYIEEKVNVSFDQANLGLFFFVGMLIVVLLFIKKKDYRYLNAEKWSTGKGIAIGIGLAFALRSVYFSLVRIGLIPKTNASVIGSVQDYFASISSYYHPALSFLFIVILIPFYEEYLFRGIALSSMEKRIKFMSANIIQAIIFSLLHGNLNLFFFYLAFGLIAGTLVRKSKSIAPSIAFHVTNNFFAFIILSRLS
ncbi:CPBP family intramembrane metalloprotease [Echinicola sp. CAU 1574]|uniref:CPBP family intramembrane metalloprotease n=1 Tax=Echinicola arenosa TaxID=2774144 RepID=A0ABR9AKF4_9BACT|nr:CPBP family glutamic-type intramembrane protease [Echinicola arenosa]MBD8489298.1 CPBP family intramembrane metalloprotease [Echinicola arenosa]